MTTRVSGNGISVTLVFPVLRQLGLVHSSADSPNLLLRCDIAAESTGVYGAQVSPLSTAQTMFFVRAYDPPHCSAASWLRSLDGTTQEDPPSHSHLGDAMSLTSCGFFRKHNSRSGSSSLSGHEFLLCLE
jgi:hypothetical protein